jgi:hypothetical protein
MSGDRRNERPKWVKMPLRVHGEPRWPTTMATTARRGAGTRCASRRGRAARRRGMTDVRGENVPAFAGRRAAGPAWRRERERGAADHDRAVPSERRAGRATDGLPRTRQVAVGVRAAGTAHVRSKRHVRKVPAEVAVLAYQLAARALIEAVIGRPRHQPLPGPGRVVALSTCRWCRQSIEQHSLYGWVHISGALILCRQPAPGAPPLCTAEPDEG